jgi:signal transduction histidine kinase
MATIIDSQNALKRQVIFAVLSLTAIGATIATIWHRLESHTHAMNLIAPPLLAIFSLALLIRLYKSPKSLHQVMHLGLLGAVLFVIVPSWSFTLEAFLSSNTSLVSRFPPLISGLFLILMLMMIILRPRHLLVAALGTWGAIAMPILTYLILHPSELTTLRGLDLVISLGPAMGVQIVLLLFFNRLQDLVDRLYQERLQYYEQIIERQTIRQRAMEQAVTQIHNGPLQTLALLMREVQQKTLPSPELLQRLTALNQEIRTVGHSLTDESIDSININPTTSNPIKSDHIGADLVGVNQIHNNRIIKIQGIDSQLIQSQENTDQIVNNQAKTNQFFTNQFSTETQFQSFENVFEHSLENPLEQTLRLGEGTCIDLTYPLHNLLHEVYVLTLKRNLPCFRTIQVKVRNFALLEPTYLTLELKRDLCLWLEEALCNVGKHAQGVTRITVTGEANDNYYTLKVQDNGLGLKSALTQQGTQLCTQLAKRLGGTFQRKSLPQGGVICELSWPVIPDGGDRPLNSNQKPD